ncbi:MAG: cyclic nucleotide-binding domain-containing protein [Alphaproteobacteria bacterium]|nr:cyclic nucleotide-binding domain-containing protein [Alphaproteobacteria bacterium]
MQSILAWQNVVHIAAICYLVCFTFRNQIYLRVFAIAGDLLYVVYYFMAPERPLWEAMFWSGLNVLINFFMIGLIVRDSRMSAHNDDEMNLFRNLRGLSPGQFRKLMQIGKWTKTAERQRLTEEGKELDQLHYVLDGKVEINKSGRTIVAEPAVFIGELAFLRQKPATATVHVAPQSVYVTWSHAELNKALAKSDDLRNALAMLLNNDLAEKVARG